MSVSKKLEKYCKSLALPDAKELIPTLAFCPLDYCNALLTGLPPQKNQ